MNIASFLVLLSFIGGVCGQATISFILDKYTVQFTETTFQMFLNCLCETTFGCTITYHNTSNILTLNSITESHLTNSSNTFFDAYVCNEPYANVQFECWKVIREPSYLPVLDLDKCSTFNYGNYTACFPKGLALFWSYGSYKVNISGVNVTESENCNDVFAEPTSEPSTTLAPEPSSATLSTPAPQPTTVQPSSHISSVPDGPATTSNAIVQSTATSAASAPTLDASQTSTPSTTVNDAQSEILSITSSQSLMSPEYASDPSSVPTSLLTLTTPPEWSLPTASPEQTPSPALSTAPVLAATSQLPGTTLLQSAPSMLTHELSSSAQSGQAAATTNTASLGVSLDVVSTVVALSSAQFSFTALSPLTTYDSYQSYSTDTAGIGAITTTPDSGGIGAITTTPDSGGIGAITTTPDSGGIGEITTIPDSSGIGAITTIPDSSGIGAITTTPDSGGIQPISSSGYSDLNPDIQSLTATIPTSHISIQPSTIIDISNTQPDMPASLVSDIIPSSLPVDNLNTSPHTAHISAITSLGSNTIETSLPLDNSNLSPGNTQTMTTALGLDTIQFSAATTATSEFSIDVPNNIQSSTNLISDSQIIYISTLANINSTNVSHTSYYTSSEISGTTPPIIGTLDTTHATSITDILNTPVYSPGTLPGTNINTATLDATPTLSSGAASVSPTDPTTTGQSNNIVSTGSSVLDQTVWQTGSVLPGDTNVQSTTDSTKVSTESSGNLVSLQPSNTGLSNDSQISWTTSPTSVALTESISITGTPSLSTTPSTASATTMPIIPSLSFTPPTASVPTASLEPSTTTQPPSNVTIPPPAENSRQQDDKDKIIAITVGVIACALFIFAIMAAIYYWRRKRQERAYQTMDGHSSSSDQPSDASEVPAAKADNEVSFDGIIPRFPNYKDFSGWDTFRPPYFTMIDIGPAGHNIIKGSVISHEDVTLADKKPLYKKKKGSSLKSVQFVNPIVEELEPDFMTSVSNNGVPKKGIIVKTVKFRNTTTESDDFEDAPGEDDPQPEDEPHSPNNDYAYVGVISNANSVDVPKEPQGTAPDYNHKSNGTVPKSSIHNHSKDQKIMEESTHF